MKQRIEPVSAYIYVAQIFNLLYRRISFCGRAEQDNAALISSALPPSATRRYSRVQLYATRPRSAFSLIEIMVVVALLSLIIFGLLAMFNETQLAFRSSMTQSDVLESGRMFMDMSGRELEQATPSYYRGFYNFYSAPPANAGFKLNFFKNPLTQWMPGMTPPGDQRTNILSDDVFFVIRQNQTWTGVGYFVRQDAADPTVSARVGTLYRWTTNMSTVQFQYSANAMWRTFNAVCNFKNNPSATTGLSSLGISKVMDGVVHFRARAYDTNGFWIMPGNLNVSFAMRAESTNSNIPGEFTYGFTSNALPAYVDLEVGVLEDRTYQHYQALASTAPAAAQLYLSNHVAQVHLFRRQIALRNVDPGAYQ